MENTGRIRIIVALVAVFIFVLAFGSSMFVKIEPGYKGVLFKTISGELDKENINSEGWHFKAPWNEMIIYNVRKQEQKETMSVLSSNGLTIKLDLSIRYQVVDSRVGYLHDELGQNYKTKLIIPEVRSACREVIGEFKPEELYSSKRAGIQEKIYSTTAKVFSENNLELDALLIRSIQLPPKIKAAIETKLQEEQEVQQKQFSIEKEKKEAERKRVEAQGIQDFQRIVTEGISAKLLKWKGIEATESLARSENSKVVIIGGGDGGLPVILNNN